MFKNYIKIAFRYLVTNRVFSLINILGLTLGFTCFIVLSLFVLDELHFDNFHADFDEIYRVVQTITEPDGSTRQVATVAPTIGPQAAKQFPEIKEYTRLIQIGRLTVGNDPLNRDYERIWIADANLFRFFDFEFLNGNPQTVLSRPDNIVITESVARKYFGRTDVHGEKLYTNVYEAQVAGVIKDFPDNSHINVNVIHSIPTWAREIKSWHEWETTNWTSNSFITYFKMRPGFDKDAFEEKITGMVTANYDDAVQYSSSFNLQPLADIHLYSGDIEGGLNVNAGNPLYIYMFSIVALLILAIACFNYMNLSTAAASRRSREVAMRKTLGANKKQLVFQFTGEALLLSLFSLILAIALIELAIPHIKALGWLTLNLPVNNYLILGGLFLVAVTAGVLSSLYPSFFLSRINTATALKNEIKIGGGKFSLRKILVIAQFSISIIMISATIIIYQQLNYLQNKDLGFNVDNLLVVDINSGNLRSQFESIKQEFENLSQVQRVTVSSRVPGEWKVFPVASVENLQEEAQAQMIFIGVDEDYLQTFNINLLAGRNLRNDASDSNSVLLSASAAKALALENPLGKQVRITGTVWDGDMDQQDHPYAPTVVGIVEDFYFESFREKRKPVMLASYRNPVHSIDYYTLRIRTNDWQGTIAAMEAINYKFDPENPMEYHFLDNRFAEFYEKDRSRGQLFLLFSVVIILVACMGLFALASFAIENRIKEIGVRKVLGASVAQITWLLASEFTLLVGIAFVISIPPAYWAVHNWLQEFAYRIPIPWWAFLAASLVALIIALGTVSFRIIRAALANPVEALRYE